MAIACGPCAGVTAGQRGLALQAIADGELWATDSGSRLLTRNDGHPAALFRLQVLAGAQLSSHVQLFALTELETGPARAGEETEVTVDQLTLRYVASPAIVLEGGRLYHPVGAFAARRLSVSNPLIGLPDGYPVVYPWGAQVQGTLSRFDYRVALVTLPISHTGYLPHADARLRPAIGAGFSPVAGVHIGLSATAGTYLSRAVQDSLPPGAAWTDFRQRVLAFDARVSRGYFESHAELSLSGYDAPAHTASTNGLSYYVEGKYTWSPRLFTALRFEVNNYAFIRPSGGASWTARSVQMVNGEAGVGYRVSAALSLKASYRRDHWPPDARAFLPNGYAAALQVSYQRGFQL
jgi:hypothetical protein